MPWPHPHARSSLFLACLLLLLGAGRSRAEPPRRAEWMQAARWGVMTHYLPDWIDPGKEWTSEDWNRLVDGFDALALARQLESVGAGYYLISIGQNSGFYLAPNPAYDRLVGIPGKCSRRDLVADLHAALSPRGIRLLVYLPSGAPNRDAAARTALQWTNGPHPNREFRARWETVVREWSLRWGTKVSGWWFDGCYWPNHMYRGEPPNFATLAAAARAGNPDSSVAFNPGVYFPVQPMSDHQDFIAGEVNDVDEPLVKENRVNDGVMDGVQLHILSYLGQTWGRGAPRLAPEKIVGVTRRLVSLRGALTWDVPVERNGTIAEPFLEQLRALGRAVADPSLPAGAAGGFRPAPRADWLKAARWGVMVHYLADWILSAEAKSRPTESWNRLVDGFDVEGLARQLESASVPYLFITIGQSSGFYLAPNPAYDELTGILPSRCSRRDLVGDLAGALTKRGIRLLVYCPGGPPGKDEAALDAFDHFTSGPHWNPGAAVKWERVVREWSRRWGGTISGWWFDGCHWPNVRFRSSHPPNFASLAAAARTGNPDAIVAFNSGLTVPIVSVTPHEDYTAGVSTDPAVQAQTPARVLDGRIDGARLHMLSYVGRTWGAGPPRATPDEIVEWTRKINAQGGAVTWDVPIEPSGLISDEFLPRLRTIGSTLASEGTVPSKP